VQRLEPRLAPAFVGLVTHGSRERSTLTALADLSPPLLQSVRVPAAVTHGLNAPLAFTLTFNEPVVVTGTPALAVRIGQTVREVPYLAGSGRRVLTFSTRVLPGDIDADGIELIAGPATSPANAIRDAAGNVATGGLPARRPDTRTVRVDGVRPMLTAISTPVVATTGKWATVTALFSEAVTVRGKPTVPLTVAGRTRQATFAQVKGNTATFVYRAAKNEVLASVVAGPLRMLPGTAIGDGAGNAAALDDWGDLLLPAVTLAPTGPRHPVGAPLFLGAAKPDADSDGQPSSTAGGDDGDGNDDEDSLDTAAVQCVRGQPLGVSIAATNLTGRPAQVSGFVDWSADGDFSDAGETFTVAVPDGSQQANIPLPLTVPVDASTTSPIPLRLRLASRLSPTEPALGPGGAARDGEVEDFLLRPAVDPMDFGDLADGPYRTLRAQDGARHSVVPGLAIGQQVDVEVDGVPTPHALGDDAAGTDDEDGFDPAAVVVVPGQGTSFTVKVTTPAGPGATLYGFTDWNNDGDFEDAGEETSVAVTGGLANVPVQLPVDVPAEAHVGEKLAVRLRLVGRSPTGAPPAAPLGPGGYAPSGEVEDYFIYIPDGKLDFGDLPDAADSLVPPWGPTIDTTTYTTADLGDYWTLLKYDSVQQGPNEPGVAARHRIRPDLYIAAPGSPSPIDAETDGQPNATATGDDLNGDDEDGVTFGGISGQVVDNVTATSADAVVSVQAVVSVKNETGSEAGCSGVFFLDKDAALEPWSGGIGGLLLVPSQPGFATMHFNFAHLLHLTKPVSSMNLAGVFRFRVSTQSDLNDVHFPRWWLHRDGEVEDYVVDLPLDFGEWWKGTYLDFGDLSDAQYPTKLAQDGARHRFTLGQQDIFLGVLPPDGDVDGKPSLAADGDDAAGPDDEDGFDPAGTLLVAGGAASFSVTVTSAAAATLVGFVDWNDDGLFTGPGETATAVVAAGSAGTTVALPWSVPAGAVTDKNLAVRLRLSTAASLGPTGLAPDGEVEDYVVTVRPRYDFGDLPDATAGTAPGTIGLSGTTTLGDYRTRLADDGPRHLIRDDLSIRGYGAPSADGESDGQPTVDASGDDVHQIDDEQSPLFTLVRHVISNTSSSAITLAVTFEASVMVDNRTGQRAFLSGFIDANNDGDFSDGGEAVEVPVASSASPTSRPLSFQTSLTVPGRALQWTARLPVRLRLSTQSGLGPDGEAPDGEVEDHVITLVIDVRG